MRGTERLLAAVERIRAERFPELPAELVEHLLMIESAHMENRDVAKAQVQTAIDTFIRTESKAHEGRD